MKQFTRTKDGWYGLQVYTNGVLQLSYYLKRRNHIRRKARKYS